MMRWHRRLQIAGNSGQGTHMADYPPPFPQNGAFIQKMYDERGGIP